MIKYDKIYNLRRIAQSFRDAIDAAKAAQEPYKFFRNFPLGQCGYTTDMLAKYLTSQGYVHLVYETGAYYWDDWESNEDHEPNQHTWLLAEGFVVDITGDQFKFYDEPIKNDTKVYVGPKTPYYEQFEVHPYGRCEITGYDSNTPTGKEMDIWYEVVMKYLVQNGD